MKAKRIGRRRGTRMLWQNWAASETFDVPQQQFFGDTSEDGRVILGIKKGRWTFTVPENGRLEMSAL